MPEEHITGGLLRKVIASEDFQRRKKLCTVRTLDTGRETMFRIYKKIDDSEIAFSEIFIGTAEEADPRTILIEEHEAESKKLDPEKLSGA